MIKYSSFTTETIKRTNWYWHAAFLQSRTWWLCLINYVCSFSMQHSRWWLLHLGGKLKQKDLAAYTYRQRRKEKERKFTLRARQRHLYLRIFIRIHLRILSCILFFKTYLYARLYISVNCIFQSGQLSGSYLISTVLSARPRLLGVTRNRHHER